MKPRALTVIIVLAALAYWQNSKPGPIPRSSAKPGQIGQIGSVKPQVVTDATGSANPQRIIEPQVDASLSANAGSYPANLPTPPCDTSADWDPATDSEKIRLMLRDYRTLTGGNPVGTNREIMRSIMGDNPKGARLGPPEGLNLNANDELLDRWGTPYFFHQLASKLMEIRSAGPDRCLWNGDDLVAY